MPQPDPIAEFLRRAAERRAQQASAKKPAAPRPAPRSPEAEVVRDAELIEKGRGVAEGVAQHVARRLDTSEFAKHASQLGAEIDQADEVMEAHLRNAFHHQLGELGGRTAPPEESELDDDAQQQGPAAPLKPASALDILGMIRRPQQLWVGFVLSDILKRPEDLW